MRPIETSIEFSSGGVTCRGLFVRPDSTRPLPLIVLAHGLGGVYEMRLDAFARRFAQAGYAALTFDYRGFGRSDGAQRHVLIRREQQADIEAAVEFGKSLEGVDASKVVLWGTSLAGGHMMDVAARRDDIAATVVQAPFTDGPASARATSPLSNLGTALFVGAHALSRLVRRKPVLVPLAAPPHFPALMSKPDVIEGVLRLMPEGSKLSGRLSQLYTSVAESHVALPPGLTTSDAEEAFDDSSFVGSVVFPSGTALINGVSANFGFDILGWRPGKNLAKARSPVLVCACENDSVAPVGPTVKYAKAAPLCELVMYPYHHFEIYVGEPHEAVLKDQLAFLRRVVPSPAAADVAPASAVQS